METLISELLKEKTVMYALIGTIYMLLISILMSTRGGRRMFGLFRSKLFYSESSEDKTDNLNNKISELEDKIASIEKEISTKVLKNKYDLIDTEINKYLDDKLKDLIVQKINASRDIENTVLSELENKIAIEVKSYLESTSIESISKASEKANFDSMKQKKNEDLDVTINEQLTNSGKVKTVMINLFIIFNIGVLLVYLLAGTTLSQHTIYAITGLYISLATFIFYIYRTSNFRTSVLLALREDGKKFYDAIEYLEKHKKGTNLTNADVELIKLLLINRSEREKMADHPYEVVLKGVANSNIQFKGGKMSLKEDKGKS